MGCTFSEPLPDASSVMTAGTAAPQQQQQRTAKPTSAANAATANSSQPAASSTAARAASAESTKQYFTGHTSASSSSASSASPRSSSSSSPAAVSSARVQSLLCPIHSVRQPRPLSCAHCMRTSTALTSYPAVSSSQHTHSLPFITAAQITSHWSARFVDPQLPSIAAHHTAALAPPSTSASYFSYLHSATSASLAYPTAASSSTHSTSSSSHPSSLLPSIKAPLAVRRKQHFSVADETSQSSGSESSTELAILTQQLSAVRQQRRQRGLGRRDDSSSIEQSTSDSDNGAVADQRADRRRTVSVARVAEQRDSGAEAEDEDGEAEADDELTSPSIERADECELSVCQKTRQLQTAAGDEKTNEDDVAYHSVTSTAVHLQIVEHASDGW